jgi:Putative zinc-finger
MLLKDTTVTGTEFMDHSQALEQMAAERYLLNELTGEAREAFEEHFFDCHECAVDLRAAAAFISEAKAQLPTLVANAPERPATGLAKPRPKRDQWFSWLRPAFAVPAFAALLAVIGYQNLVTMRALRSEAGQPRLLAWAPLHGVTRGGTATTIAADRRHDIGVSIDVTPEPGNPSYDSYSFDLVDAQGKTVWTLSAASPVAQESGRLRIGLVIPVAPLRNGIYSVAVFGAGPNGQRTLVDRYSFDLRFTN